MKKDTGLGVETEFEFQPCRCVSIGKKLKLPEPELPRRL